MLNRKETMEIKFYGASKIWHAPKWQAIRAQGFNNVARWIDIEGDSTSEAVYKGKEITREDIWNFCLDDVTAADCVIFYCGDSEEEQRGAIMEAGHAIGQGKPVYCINHCETVRACGIADVAFTHHRLWNWVAPNEWLSFEVGFRRAFWKATNDRFLLNENKLKLAAKRNI